jgi:hypothetical protein
MKHFTIEIHSRDIYTKQATAMAFGILKRGFFLETHPFCIVHLNRHTHAIFIVHWAKMGVLEQ